MWKQLEQIRRIKSVSLAQLSRDSGISRAALTKLQNGDQEPRLSHIRTLAEALNVPPLELIPLETAEESPHAVLDAELSISTSAEPPGAILSLTIPSGGVRRFVFTRQQLTYIAQLTAEGARQMMPGAIEREDD